MAITFPAGPHTDGDIFTNTTTGVKYIYNAADDVWKTHVWPTNTNYLQLSGGTLTGDLSLGTNDLTAQDITTTGAVSVGTGLTVGNGLTVSDGNVVMAAGHGIDFSATADGTGASNVNELFDDYEHGTFTPAYAGSSTAGSFTYSTQLGYYTKIGRQVFVEIALTNITEVTAGAGTLRVEGLPFANTESFACGSARFDNFNFAAGTNYVVPVRGGDTFIQFQEVKTGAVDSAMSVADRGSNASDLFLSFTYTVI